MLNPDHCDGCGKQLRAHVPRPARVRHRFCSKSCYAEFMAAKEKAK